MCANRHEGDAGQKRVLVVNDNALQRRIVGTIVERMGHAVRFAADGAEGYAVAKAETFDLIILDLYMPKLDGWKLCRLLREAPREHLRGVPILIQSATFSGIDTETASREVGADGFIAFPYTSEELQDTVRKLLAGVTVRRRLSILILATDALGDEIEASAVDRGDVERVSTPDAVLASFARRMPDVALIDTAFAGEDVLGLVARLRAPGAPTVVLVAASGRDDSVADRAIEIGADGVLHPPRTAETFWALYDRASRERALLRVEELLEQRTRDLARSEQRCRCFWQDALDGVLTLEPDGKIIDANVSFAAAIGQTAEGLAGAAFADLGADEERDEITASVVRAAAGKSSSFEARFRGPDARTAWHWVKMRPLRDPLTNEIVAVHVIARDVSERRAAQRALADKEARLRTILSTAPDAIVELDNAGNLLWQNDAARRLFSDGALGRPYWETIAPAARGDFVRQDPLSLCDKRIMHGEAEPRLISWRCGPVRDDAGHRIGVIAVGRDVTDLDRRERDYRRMLDLWHESQRMESIGAVTNMLAHDFNNTLLSILGFAELIGESLPPETESVEDLRFLIGAAQKAKGQIQNVLAFARHDRTTKAAFDLRAVVRETLHLLDIVAPRPRPIVFEVTETPCVVLGDSRQIRRAIVELLLSADRESAEPIRVAVETFAPRDRSPSARLVVSRPMPADTADLVADLIERQGYADAAADPAHFVAVRVLGAHRATLAWESGENGVLTLRATFPPVSASDERRGTA
ncbi:response regulator [bacterium]|nr:response regulator [bacterium]